MMLVMVPFCPESPRWLISHGKSTAAHEALNRIRPQRDVDSGLTFAEVQAIEQAVDEQLIAGNGRWMDLFRGTNFRRAMASHVISTLAIQLISCLRLHRGYSSFSR